MLFKICANINIYDINITHQLCDDKSLTHTFPKPDLGPGRPGSHTIGLQEEGLWIYSADHCISFSVQPVTQMKQWI